MHRQLFRVWLIFAVLSLVATSGVVLDFGLQPAHAAASPGNVRGASYTYHYIDTPGRHGRALSVSDDKVVVGEYITPTDNNIRPFIYKYDPVFTFPTQDLPLDPGFTSGVAITISPDGKLIGGSEQTPGSPNPCYAVMWSKQPDGSYSLAKIRQGDNEFSGDNVTDACSVRGFSATNDGKIYMRDDTLPGGGYVWNNGVVTKSNLLEFPGKTISNDGLRLVNQGDTATAITAQGGNLPLGPLTGSPSSATAFSLSLNHDEIVGSSVFTGTPPPAQPGLTSLPHAVRWDMDSGAGYPVDLNDVTAYQDPQIPGGGGNPEGATLTEAFGVNNNGDIAGSAYNAVRAAGFEAPMILVALPPVVFVPGVAGSHLVDASGTELWLAPFFTSHSRLALAVNPQLTADRLLQYEYCIHNICPHDDLLAYGPFLDAMHNSGFVDYLDGGDPNRRTTNNCDTSQRPNNPNLFIFPYDWRQSNEVTAKKLADFMGCVEKFYSGPVVMVAHSMGGLVARRYILDTGKSSAVRDLATIATPWLGAPKLMNALETGDFAPPLTHSSTIKQILPPMTGPRELLPSPDYYQVAPPDPLSGNPLAPFQEEGWDINGDLNANPIEPYTYGQFNALLDKQTNYNNVGVTTAAYQFHADLTSPGQDDWRNDDSGVKYTVMYGQQSLPSTIGQVKAVSDPACSISNVLFRCSPVNRFRTVIVDGDHTVPTVSASRVGNGIDLNNQDHERLIAVTGGPDNLLDHDGLTHNPQVENEILYLDGRLNLDPFLTGASAQAAKAALRTITPPTAATAAVASTGNLSGWYVDLVGFSGDTAVTAPDGRSDALQPSTGEIRPGLPDVTHISEGDQAELTILPFDGTGVYTETFTVADQPLSIDLRRGSQQAPDARVSWRDIALPAGSVAQLTLSAGGTSALTYKAPGTTTDIPVSPTTSVTGAVATYDLVPPTVNATATVIDGRREYVLSADNGGISAIKQILWSADGTTFQPYTGPIALDPANSTLQVFADDAAGNRSPVRTFDMKSLPIVPFTTATVVPSAAQGGYSASPATVVLQSHTSDGTTSTLDYRIIPPTGHPSEFTTAGPIATINIPDNGRTSIRYFTSDNTGAHEASHFISVGVDTSEPTVAITNPVATANLSGFTKIEGTASDPASGISSATVSIQRNADRLYWSGAAWQSAPASLQAYGTTSWSLTASLPSGPDAPVGAYTIAASVSSLSGKTGTTHIGVTLSPYADIRPLTLPSGTTPTVPTGGSAINDSGQVAGMIGESFQGSYTSAARWDADGSVHVLSSGFQSGLIPNFGSAINNAGQVAGHNSSGAAFWLADGTTQNLPSGGGGACSGCDEALALNNQGVVAGQSIDKWGTWAGPRSPFVQLPIPAGAPSVMGSISAAPLGMNDAGVIVGSRLVTQPDGSNRYVAATATSTSSAFLFPADTGAESFATAINQSGDIVGHANPTGRSGWPGDKPYLRTGDGAIVWIDPSSIGLSGGSANGINQSRVIVGNSSDPAGNSQPWIYSKGVLKNLNGLLPPGSGWQLTTATGINKDNVIVGNGSFNGTSRGYVLTLAGPDQLETPPLVSDVSVAVKVNTAATIPLTAQTTATEPMVWTIVGSPSHGTASIQGNAVAYTPANGFNGTDQFTVQVSNGSVNSNVATVNLTVGTPPPPPPIAIIDAPSAAGEGAPFVVNGAASFDPNGAPLSYTWSFTGTGSLSNTDTAQAIATLAGPGPHTLTLKVSSPYGTSAATVTVTVVKSQPSVQNQGPASLTVAPVNGVEGGSSAQQVASFTDTDPSASASTLTADIDWGDGHNGTGTIAGPNGSGQYTITAAPPYGEEGAYSVHVTVKDSANHAVSATGMATVLDAPLAAIAKPPIEGVEGSALPANTLVAAFRDSNPSSQSSDFTATIEWGDGTRDPAVIAGPDSAGEYTIFGSHTYTEENTYTTTTAVIDKGGSKTIVSGTARMKDAPVSVSPIENLTGHSEVSNLQVGTINDANPKSSAADFSVQLDWGDGTTSTGSLSGPMGGPYAISGSHTFSALGPQNIHISVSDDGGEVAVTSANLVTYSNSAGGNFVVGDLNAIVGRHVTFWSSTWAAENMLTGGATPDAFKGFETQNGPPIVGNTWIVSSGNSGSPPSVIPTYMAVAVSSTVKKSGPTIAGNTVGVVVIKIDTGYSNDPGHRGTGQVVAIVR